MAKKVSRSRKKRKSPKAGLGWQRWAAGAALVVVLGGGWGWWSMRHWAPPRAKYATQGAEIGVADGDVDFAALKAIGADFVYIDASSGAHARDAQVVSNLDGARAAHLQIGALHTYDPCQSADKQAANFVTVVPRDAKMLPPAVELNKLAEDCPEPVSDAAVMSELTVFLNQIETHTGKPAILKLGPAFEAKYHVASALENRNLWLVRDRIEPDYAARPWAMWTANTGLMNKAIDQPMRWVVVQP